MTSIIKVDQIQTVAGATPKAADLGINTTGTVLQVVNTRFNLSMSTSNTTFTQTGHNVTITPTSTSSRIIIALNGGSWYALNTRSMLTVFRTVSGGSSVNLGDPTDGVLAIKEGTTGSSYLPHSLLVIDSPNTTSATTYDTRLFVETANTTTYYSYPTYGYIELIAYEIAG
jgi:hypothetical protein